jgi:hypothetical protein
MQAILECEKAFKERAKLKKQLEANAHVAELQAAP